jgi:hypothetical protein
VDTVARGEMVESDLDRLITKRDKERRRDRGEREREALWAASVRRHHARRRQELAWEWLRHHERQLNNQRTTFAILERHHRQEIAKYETMLGLDGPGPNGKE